MPARRRAKRIATRWPTSGWNGCVTHRESEGVLDGAAVCGDRRNAQRPSPPVCLRDIPPLYRCRSVSPGLEVALDRLQELRDPTLLDGRDRLAIHPRSALIAPHPAPRVPQDVTPVDPVVQRVEPPPPTPLGRSPQRSLEFSHFVFRVV